DTYLVSERGIYRPGETLTLTALTRDPRAHAVTGVPLTFVLKRPDGVEQQRELVPDQGLGSYQLRAPLLKDAMRGTWQAQVYADPKAEALARTHFLVEDFEPERLDFSVEPSASRIDPSAPPSLSIDARFLYGAPAANLEVSGMTRVTLAEGLADWPGWQFGLASESVQDRSEPLPGAETNADGQALLSVELPTLVASTRPLQALIDVQVFDGGGRPVERNLSLPILDQRPRIGIKPLFEGAVDQGGNARFAAMVIGADGKPMPAAGLRWTLSRVRTSYQWYRTDGDWRFEPVVSRTRVASGDLDVGADPSAPAQLEAPVDWGAYELRVESGDGSLLVHGSRLVPASIGFEAGWYVAPKAFDTPDVLKVSLDKAEYRVGEQAQVRLEPRFPGLALVMVIGGDGLVSMHPAEVPETGASVAVPVTADWGPGAYVTAILYRGMDLKARRMPRRAIGLHWAGVDPERRQLSLALETPELARPREPLSIGVQIDDLAPSEEAFVTLAAVDLGILNLTRFKAWSPADWYFGQRRLGAELRDLYGQLIDRMQGEPGRLRTGSGAGQLMSFEGPPPTEALVAFQTEPLRLDGQGRAQVSFDLPDFNGQVRVMAMAWSATGVGQALADVLVRDPIVVTAAMPRFLAPGDRSRILLELAHVEGPAGPIEVSLTSNGKGLRIENDGTPMLLDLSEQGRAQLAFSVQALGGSLVPSNNELLVRLVTPTGDELTKQLILGVRNLEPEVARTQAIPLEPGAPPLRLQTLASNDSGLLPSSAYWSLSISGAGALDVPGLLWALDRYPFGCVEQLTSRALPLLYLDAVTLNAGLAVGTKAAAMDERTSATAHAPTAADDAEDDVTARIRKAIAEILAHQHSTGGFGLWQPGLGDLWLDAYVTDFLTRAREQGYQVQANAFGNALDNLRNQLSYAADFDKGGEGIAYALYVLARNSRVPVGDLRYYLETKLDAFATPMARAQLGAALALFGETQRAATALRSAQTLWEQQTAATGWRADFGSHLRDGAALLALAAEAGGNAIDISALGNRLEEVWAATDYPSTQDQAWMLLAAHALMDGAAKPRLSINGRPHDGAFFRRGQLGDLAPQLIGTRISSAAHEAASSREPGSAPTSGSAPASGSASALKIANAGDRPLTAMLTRTGIPAVPAPAGGHGYSIERSYYDLEGRRVDPTQITQGARLVVLITVRADQQRAARLLINDPLPAGLEIDNPHLLRSGSIEGLPWLNLVTEPAHIAFGSDRFAAAVERERRDPRSFQLAYVVRAISPGRFAHPAAQVEAMYQPSLRARTASGFMAISAPE
ncbi:alpha-2-macroglobulin family protein, partial [Halochromatium sp.]